MDNSNSEVEMAEKKSARHGSKPTRPRRYGMRTFKKYWLLLFYVCVLGVLSGLSTEKEEKRESFA